VTTLAAGMDYVDLLFLGRPQIIATGVLQSTSGVALVDPGPSTTLDRLLSVLEEKGIRVDDVTHVLLTHIHLDHAGATGTLLDRNGCIEVFVHEAGVQHMVDPSRLLASAGRLYGADMQRLWGEVRPVPRERVRVLQGGESIVVAGRTLEVAYTPGHASHHVSYFDQASGVAFVGDTAGIRRGAGTFVMPPTPPPDIDLEAWRASADRILAWNADTLFLTHFGAFRGARMHLQELFERLAEWSRLVRRLLADDSLSDSERQDRFVEVTTLELRRVLGETDAEQYTKAGRIDFSWQGLSRYWRKRDQHA
jgi:glyoxylase-like metal-dependent hydrolase (beta-lactamase superfamily II)